MRFSRLRLWAAGVVAFFFGFPLTEKALAASSWDVVGGSIDLGLAIADSAGDS